MAFAPCVHSAPSCRPIGAGPFKFVSMEVGVELVVEAREAY